MNLHLWNILRHLDNCECVYSYWRLFKIEINEVVPHLLNDHPTTVRWITGILEWPFFKILIVNGRLYYYLSWLSLDHVYTCFQPLQISAEQVPGGWCSSCSEPPLYTGAINARRNVHVLGELHQLHICKIYPPIYIKDSWNYWSLQQNVVALPIFRDIT